MKPRTFFENMNKIDKPLTAHQKGEGGGRRDRGLKQIKSEMKDK